MIKPDQSEFKFKKTDTVGAASAEVDETTEVDDFKRILFIEFYRVGLIGLKLESFESASWVDELGQGVSPSEIDDSTHVVVHPTYHRALGIKTVK